MKKMFIPGLMMALLAFCSLLCLGDTIYLKNGEKIQTTYAEVKGNQVIFSKFGGMVSLPMTLVDRIESDSYVEPEKSSEAAPASTAVRTSSTPTSSPATGSSSQDSAQRRLEMQKKNAQYWVKRKQELTDRLNDAEQKLQAARANNLAMRYAGGAGLALSGQQIEALEREITQLREQLDNLDDEARRYGIAPGVLRE
jgi:hypothetical protein